MVPITEEKPAPAPTTAFGKLMHTLGDYAQRAWDHGTEIAVGRMSQWLWLTVALVGVLLWLNAELAGPLLKVLTKITLAASLGYAVDRTAFRGFRPHEPAVAAFQLGTELKAGTRNAESTKAEIRHLRLLSAAYQLRRALIIGCCILGSTMGL